MIELYNEDCLEVMDRLDLKDFVLVIDPPFNIGYKYKTYKDKLKKEKYLDWLKEIVDKFDKFVLIHYPEDLFEISIHIGKAPQECISWVYNSNTNKQHRMIAYYGFTPDRSLVKQPYKNPNDKRVKKLIEKGSAGTKLYDWFQVNQVKNVSKEKTEHPCQMPLEVMRNVIGIIPDNNIIDCFLGSGSTGVACKELNKNFIGIELDEHYFEIAKERIYGVDSK